MVGWTEVVAGTLLALGFLHLLAALALLVIISGALVIVQIPGGFAAGLERDMMIFVGLAVLLAHGPGGWSVDARLGDTGP